MDWPDSERPEEVSHSDPTAATMFGSTVSFSACSPDFQQQCSYMKTPRQGFHTNDDGWMLPFDELLQRRSQTVPDTSPQGLYDGCVALETMFVPAMEQLASMGLTCKPMLSSDGQQLYTNGEQFFVFSESSTPGPP